uniref:Protein relish n=1 Tax=Plautia stali TaxID=106108 RepID=A0A499U9N9_PLAST|nr:protein relish [Plautia stali]
MHDYDDNGSLGYCSDQQYSPEHNIWLPHPDQNSAWIEFTEEPADYRYRYLKEKYHGHIVGVSSPATKKKDLCKFPKLKLYNYSGSAIVRVWLISPPLDKLQPHFHKLARKLPKGELKLEPHDFRACEENNYEVTLDYLHIVHAVTNDESDINVYRKKKAHIESELFDPPRSVPISIKEEKEEIKQIDKNQSYFYIQVFDENTRMSICQPAISNKIKNLHNAETGALRIVNCSRIFGTCRGDDEVFIFVEKISKDVQVRFFTLDNNNKKVWEAPAKFGPQNVHHQLGIVFRTPRFEQNIDKDVQAYFELHRTSDGAVSDKYPFTYKPHEDYKCNDMAKKRPHSPEVMSSEDKYIPYTVTSFNSKRIKEESKSPDSTTHIQAVTNIAHYDPCMVSLDMSNNTLQPIDALFNSEISNILDSMQQNELGQNAMSVGLMENSESTWPTMTYQDILLDEASPLFKSLGQNINFDSVSSTDDDTDEDLENVIVAEGQIGFCQKPLSANDDNPGRFNGVSTSEVKSGRKSSQSEELLSAINNKKPLPEYKKLLETTDDINTVDYEGNSALHYAVRSSTEYLIPILEREDLDKNLKNLWGDNPLLEAVRSDNMEIVKLLLEKDFEPNIKNSRTGETPLHLAVSNGNCLMVELLLKHGADPFLDNNSDKSAYEYSLDCNKKQRRQMFFLMQKNMFQKRKSFCSKEASDSSESELVSKLNDLTVSTS